MEKMIQVPYKTKRYFTNDDNANLIYFQFPKLLMYGDKYKKMSADGKLFYMLCLDLIKLSMKNGWKDEYGRYYIKMSLDTIQERMNCAREKANNLKKELCSYELMEVKRIGQGKSNRLYVLQLEYSDEDIYKANNDHEDIQNDEESILKDLGALESQQKYENRTSKSSEIELQEVRFPNPIKNLSFKNSSIKSFDDDKRRTSSLSREEELLISTLREELKGDLIDRSFNAVVRKVVDKHKQGKVTSFRDYLVTSLIAKIEELELRRMKDKANAEIIKSKANMKRKTLSSIEVRELPFYDWLND